MNAASRSTPPSPVKKPLPPRFVSRPSIVCTSCCFGAPQLTSVLMPLVTPKMVSRGTPLLPPQLSCIAPFLETKFTVTFLGLALPLKGCCSTNRTQKGKKNEPEEIHRVCRTDDVCTFIPDRRTGVAYTIERVHVHENNKMPKRSVGCETVRLAPPAPLRGYCMCVDGPLNFVHSSAGAIYFFLECVARAAWLGDRDRVLVGSFQMLGIIDFAQCASLCKDWT